MVVAPAAKHEIELLDQGRHRGRNVGSDQRSHFPNEGEDSLFCRGNAQYLAPFAESLPEERQSPRDLRDHGLLRREFQTPLSHRSRQVRGIAGKADPFLTWGRPMS